MIELPTDATDRWHAGMRLRILMDAALTSGRFALCDLLAPPGSATPVHRHEHEDEVVFVRSGRLGVWEQGTHHVVEAGSSVVLPRGRPHRLVAEGEGDTAFLLAIVPGGFERTLSATSTAISAPPLDPDDLAAHFAGAGVSLLGWRTP